MSLQAFTCGKSLVWTLLATELPVTESLSSARCGTQQKILRCPGNINNTNAWMQRMTQGRYSCTSSVTGELASTHDSSRLLAPRGVKASGTGIHRLSILHLGTLHGMPRRKGEPRFALQRPLATSRCARDDLQKVKRVPSLLSSWSYCLAPIKIAVLWSRGFPRLGPRLACAHVPRLPKLKRSDIRRPGSHGVLTLIAFEAECKRSWRSDFEFWTKRSGELSLRWVQRWCSIFGTSLYLDSFFGKTTLYEAVITSQ